MFKSRKQVVVDGEGARKFVTINVINAKSLAAQEILRFLLLILLVKIAVAGEDPNWGRIVRESENLRNN